MLTLGALAELEAAFGAEDLVALAERFGSGRLTARDLIRVIAAGLRGAGEAVSDEEVARMAVADGAAGYVRIAADLITATFGAGDAARPSATSWTDMSLAPFPWRQAIGFGLGVLRLSPQAFWAMTPRELAFAIEAVLGRSDAPLARDVLATLMRRFPDSHHGVGGGSSETDSNLQAATEQRHARRPD